jgi:HD-GYP domain-containing protein (c-di-GMP phosphodiesterase class II)
MHLRELSKAVLDKKRQMESDFLRISGRYTKTFDDLNNELSNRIFELDRQAFVFKKELDNQSIRTTNNDLVNTVAVFGKEGSELQSKISASIAKKRALDTINKARIFLWQQKKLHNTVQQSMLNEKTEAPQYSPVCFIETYADKTQITRGLYVPTYVTTLNENQTKNKLIEEFTESTNSWRAITPDYADSLKLYFNSELNTSYNYADRHSVRVKEMIQKIANLGAIQTLSI